MKRKATASAGPAPPAAPKSQAAGGEPRVWRGQAHRPSLLAEVRRLQRRRRSGAR